MTKETASPELYLELLPEGAPGLTIGNAPSDPGVRYMPLTNLDMNLKLALEGADFDLKTWTWPPSLYDRQERWYVDCRLDFTDRNPRRRWADRDRVMDFLYLHANQRRPLRFQFGTEHLEVEGTGLIDGLPEVRDMLARSSIAYDVPVVLTWQLHCIGKVKVTDRQYAVAGC